MSDQPINWSVEEQKGFILGIFAEFAESDEDGDILSFFEHVGFDLQAIRNIRELPAAILGHYRLQTGSYDCDRAANDLATWPPIAARIAELIALQMRGLPIDL